MRIGGDTTDWTWISLAGMARPPWVRFSLTRPAVYRISNLAAYLRRRPLIRGLGDFYDWLVLRLGLTALMGDACLVCQAPCERDRDGGAHTSTARARHQLRDRRFTWGPPRRPPWPVG